MSISTNTVSQYIEELRIALEYSLALRSFSSATVERHNKPEIEIPYYRSFICRSSPFTILEPIKITKGESESILIERSINSARVSFKIKKADDVERLLVSNFARFLMHRAETLLIIRKLPVKGFDISFLITNVHVEQMLRQKIIDFFCYFLEVIDKEVSSMKINVNSQARYSAEEFLKQVTNYTIKLL